MLVDNILGLMIVGLAIWSLFEGYRDSRISKMNARATRFLEGIKDDLTKLYKETKISDRRISVTLMDKEALKILQVYFNADFCDPDEMYFNAAECCHKTFKKSVKAAELIAEVRSFFSLPSGIS